MTKYFGAGVKVRQLNTTSVDGTVLTLNFTDATEIEAGQPYLVKPVANVDFSADGKEFASVDLTASATPTATTYVNFVPTLGKTLVEGNVKDILILNTSGTLVHPSTVGNMKGFRGYFLMHDAPAGARAFVINFDFYECPQYDGTKHFRTYIKDSLRASLVEEVPTAAITESHATMM